MIELLNRFSRLTPRRLWQNASVGHKLYALVGVMGLLIAFELMTLVFAMNILSSLRVFVHGEALWSKGQKDAIISLNEYAQTSNQEHYLNFLKNIQVPLGDRQALLEIEKESADNEIVRRGFLIGRIHADDIDGLIKVVKRFGKGNYLSRAFEVWKQADKMIDELIFIAEDLHQSIISGSKKSVKENLTQINRLNTKLTYLEEEFSLILGEGSRWLEQFLLLSLFTAVLMVESTGLILTISFARKLSSGLRQINHIASKIRDGDFSQKVTVEGEDELGQLGETINNMSVALSHSLNQQRLAELASQTKSQFLANMSHEIRTPVGAMVGFADLLNDPGLSREEQQNYIQVIRRTGHTLTQIIDDILDLSKVEAGHFDIDNSTCSLSHLLRDIETIIQAKCQSKSIRFIIRQVGYVPDLISTDPLRLRQILLNILGNAAKFTAVGYIELTYKRLDKHIIFEVQDRGIGIAPAQIPLLFQPFSQVDSSSTRRHEGTGLGLVLSRRLANLLGGDVELVHSVLGQGSLFRIKIGYQPATDLSQTIGNKKLLPLSTTKFLAGKKVLVIDDNEDNLFLLNRILSKQGIVVTQVNQGFEGVQLALNKKFDAILLDIQMPLMDGYTVAKKIRAHGITVPIIALTAHAMKEDRIKCLNAGCNVYLSKPIQVDSLMKMLDEQMNSSQVSKNLPNGHSLGG